MLLKLEEDVTIPFCCHILSRFNLVCSRVLLLYAHGQRHFPHVCPGCILAGLIQWCLIITQLLLPMVSLSLLGRERERGGSIGQTKAAKKCLRSGQSGRRVTRMSKPSSPSGSGHRNHQHNHFPIYPSHYPGLLLQKPLAQPIRNLVNADHGRFLVLLEMCSICLFPSSSVFL